MEPFWTPVSENEFMHERDYEIAGAKARVLPFATMAGILGV
jgi:hypothetical protein